jgi:2-hydroxy-3-keto-5-methylthiopentenyl-1-phosphate phosphatase
MRLVLDWDGTVTERDSLWMVLDAFGDPEVFASVEGALAEGRLSFREVMELEFASVTAPLGEVVAFLEREASIRPGFAELAREQAPLVLSSGFHELIEPLLARERVELDVRANRLETGADGWRVLWRDPEPCPVCGDLCKRRTLPSGPLAYAGDGYSDRCAALAADRVFARAGLADWLAREGVAFEPFGDLHDVASALRAGAR